MQTVLGKACFVFCPQREDIWLLALRVSPKGSLRFVSALTPTRAPFLDLTEKRGMWRKGMANNEALAQGPL